MKNNPIISGSSSDRIQNAFYAFTQSQLLFTAIDLDLFTYISQGYSNIVQLAKKTGLDGRGLHIFLNGLVGIGFLQVKQVNTFALPPDVEQFLVRDSATYIGGMAHHCKRLYENWSMLTESVRSGQPVGGAQSLAQMEVYFSELAQGLYVSNASAAQRLCDLLDSSKVRLKGDTPLNILDVAGGSAVWSIAMLERNARSTATLIDFSSVIEIAERYVTKHGLADRFTYCPGDLEEIEVLPQHFDVIILANICHALGEFATRKTFQKLSKALKPGGVLVIIDFVPDNNRSEVGWPLVFGVNMLITTPEGDVFTRDEYSEWLKAAGFQTVTFEEVDKEVTAILSTC
jgi:ubiquinone/menaquinone biosynthesis C-methylase UbiE